MIKTGSILLENHQWLDSYWSWDCWNQMVISVLYKKIHYSFLTSISCRRKNYEYSILLCNTTSRFTQCGITDLVISSYYLSVVQLRYQPLLDQTQKSKRLSYHSKACPTFQKYHSIFSQTPPGSHQKQTGWTWQSDRLWWMLMTPITAKVKDIWYITKYITYRILHYLWSDLFLVKLLLLPWPKWTKIQFVQLL